MSERERFLVCLIHLLQREVDCLRSVLSEYDGDKSEYVQMNMADSLRITIENIEGGV